MQNQKYHAVGDFMDTKDAGARGGAARAESLTSKRIKAIAKAANKARWDKYYAENPGRTRPKKKRKTA